MTRKTSDQAESRAAQQSGAASDFPTDMGNPARRALMNAGYTRLDQLTTVRAAEILKLHGMGPKGIDQLRRALAAKGLAFLDA